MIALVPARDCIGAGAPTLIHAPPSWYFRVRHQNRPDRIDQQSLGDYRGAISSNPVRARHANGSLLRVADITSQAAAG